MKSELDHLPSFLLFFSLLAELSGLNFITKLEGETKAKQNSVHNAGNQLNRHGCMCSLEGGRTGLLPQRSSGDALTKTFPIRERESGADSPPRTGMMQSSLLFLLIVSKKNLISWKQTLDRMSLCILCFLLHCSTPWIGNHPSHGLSEALGQKEKKNNRKLNWLHRILLQAARPPSRGFYFLGCSDAAWKVQIQSKKAKTRRENWCICNKKNTFFFFYIEKPAGSIWLTHNRNE